MFQAPHPIDVSATVEVPTPAGWRTALPERETVAVLRLCDDEGPAMPGWCTATGDLQGPEIEVLCGGINTKQPTHAGLWRQGNLLHFGFEPRPGEYNATGKKLLLNAIAYIARFTTDRPIVHRRSFVDPAGAGPSMYWLDHMRASPKVGAQDLADLFASPWRERLAALALHEARAFVNDRQGALCVEGTRFAFDEDALHLGVDRRDRGAPMHLAQLLATNDADRARRVLQRLLPEGPAADTTPNNWKSWLTARASALCFDPHSLVWRIDPLALRRDRPSVGLQGPLRADGDAVRDPAATALAAKVAAHHGGARTLDDLQSFRCRIGEVHCLWDRRAGILRLENHGSIPAGNFATPWKVAIYDTAAEVDLLRGGGPEPRPFVSGRGHHRDLQERLFLPLLLLDPGTSLRVLSDDEAGRARLEVRLAGRGADPKKVHVLHVHRDSGAIAAIDVAAHEGGRATTWSVGGTVVVGPLRLPGTFVREGRTPLTIEYSDAVWNPPVPAAAATARDMLLGQ